MKLLKYSIVFLIFNFGALAIGNLFMGKGPQTQWYLSLNKAPWTPPGWVFGVAWSVIMVCFSVYMAILYKSTPSTSALALFAFQFILNISWNYVFFNQHFIALGFLVIVMLTGIVAIFTLHYINTLKINTWLIAPYLLWLCIATSLNGYILLKN